MSAALPLDSILVIDLTRALAGPHAGMTLGDLGARVIKVEQADGDDSRGWGPPFVGGEAHISSYYLAANRNKESIVLDLKDAEDSEVLSRLIARADVLLENFRPGAFERLGFPMARIAELNPRLVVLSITGFGHDGPERDRAGYDQILQGEAGLMSVTGERPGAVQKVGVPAADLLAGMNGVIGILAALVERDRTGRGGVVRTSLLSSVVGFLAFQGTRWTVAHEVPQAAGNHHPSISPYGAFACGDGVVQISVGSERLWQAFAPLVGIDPAEPRWATNQDRVRDRAALTAAIESRFADRTRAELVELLAGAGIPVGIIRTIDEVFAWEQARAQRGVVTVEHPVLGEVELPGSPLRFFELDGRETTRQAHLAPPALGQDGEAIRRWLDSSPESSS